MKRHRLLLPTLLLAGACTPPLPPPPSPPLILTAPPPTASAAPAPIIDGALVSVAAVRPPATPVLDGDLAEWGSLLPASPKAPPPDPVKAPSEDAPLPSGPNPASASSHLALALGNDGVTIAADLGEPAKEGIWLGIGAVPLPVPSIGLFARGGYIRPFDCDFEQIRMMEGEWGKGKPNPPEVVAACHGLIARHAELVARHDARFTRLFKLDRDGVHGADADGTLVPIEGAKAVFKPGPRGATVEVALPLRALPRLVEAPVVTLRLVARAVTGPKPGVLPAQWVEVELPDPVTFEPFGDLRNHSFQRLERLGASPVFSYQPGDPLHVETLHYEQERKAESVAAREETLHGKPLARLGDIEVGYVSESRPWMAIFKNGKFHGEAGVFMSDSDYDSLQVTGAFSPLEPHGAVTRGGEIHVFAYGPMSIAAVGAIRWPSWFVTAIAADGSVRNVVEDAHLPMMVGSETTGFISPDHASFGVRGPAQNLDNHPGHPEMIGLEATWTWNPVKKMYLARQRRYPLSKAKGPK